MPVWSGPAATVSSSVRRRPSPTRTVGSTLEETGQRVHEAALRLFAQKGFAATGIREIAEAAGVSSGALYHYMGTKHDLLLAINASTIEPLLEAGQEILSGDDEPEVKLAALVELHVWFHGSHPLATTITDPGRRCGRCCCQADARVSRRVGRPVDRRWPARTDTGDCLGAVAQSARSS
jgi:AcrR family transcriptional regulator